MVRVAHVSLFILSEVAASLREAVTESNGPCASRATTATKKVFRKMKLAGSEFPETWLSEEPEREIHSTRG
jgi:hypothetical protein